MLHIWWKNKFEEERNLRFIDNESGWMVVLLTPNFNLWHKMTSVGKGNVWGSEWK